VLHIQQDHSHWATEHRYTGMALPKFTQRMNYTGFGATEILTEAELCTETHRLDATHFAGLFLEVVL
jgi:hypothetical protein